jgi:hypothetical protein
MPVVDVGKMFVRVHRRLVPMPVPVPHVRFDRLVVRTLVMRIVLVLMHVLHCFVTMLVHVPFSEMEPNTDSHQDCGHD